MEKLTNHVEHVWPCWESEYNCWQISVISSTVEAGPTISIKFKIQDAVFTDKHFVRVVESAEGEQSDQ